MEMRKEHKVGLPRAEVWRALNDPQVLEACIPGCESVEQISDSEFNTKLTAKVGPVKARFNGKVRLDNLDPPRSYTAIFEGSGGQAGFAKGQADVALNEDGDGGCTIAYTVSANVGGKLAQVGSRLIDGAARKLADQFFTNLTDRFAGTEEAAQPEPSEQAEAVPTTSSGAGWLWWAAGAVVVLVLLYLIL